MSEKTYIARKVCRNCGKNKIVDVPFAIPMVVYEKTQECDYCGCECIVQKLED